MNILILSVFVFSVVSIFIYVMLNDKRIRSGCYCLSFGATKYITHPEYPISINGVQNKYIQYPEEVVKRERKVEKGALIESVEVELIPLKCEKCGNDALLKFDEKVVNREWVDENNV